MRTTISTAGLRPYDDGSGFREEVEAKWMRRDTGEDVCAHVEIKQGEQRIVCTFAEWRELARAVDETIAQTGWGPVTNGERQESDRG